MAGYQASVTSYIVGDKFKGEYALTYHIILSITHIHMYLRHFIFVCLLTYFHIINAAEWLLYGEWMTNQSDLLSTINIDCFLDVLTWWFSKNNSHKASRTKKTQRRRVASWKCIIYANDSIHTLRSKRCKIELRDDWKYSKALRFYF